MKASSHSLEASRFKKIKGVAVLIALTLFVNFNFLLAQSVTQLTFEPANIPNDQQNPAISPDGKLMFFTVCNHPQNTGGVRDAGDIWYSTFNGTQWSVPVHAGAAINDKGYNGVAGFSPDGQQLFLLTHYDSQGNEARSQGISVSKKSGGGWSRPQNITIPYFQNKSSFHGGFLSADGSVFVYSAETYGSYGVEDIYVCRKRDDGSWSEPRNLGNGINTSFQELSPSLSADGKTLYFSTNGRKGLGGFDVFSSNRLDDTWLNWSTPENMGPQVNSEGRELFFKQYPTLGYSIYTSSTNSDGYGDIKVYAVVPPIGDSSVVYSPPVVVEVKKEEPLVKVNNNLKITGKVTNSKTGEVVIASLVFTASDTTVSSNSSSTGYAAEVKPGKSYRIDIEAKGYVGNVQKLDASKLETKNLEMDFNLQPIEVGTTVTLKNVLFMQSKPELLPDSYPELDEVVRFMKSNPNVEIELSGHTDNRGSFRQLMSLSQQRVNKVKSYLVSKGISSKRIIGRGYGGSKPIASNDTEETRALNRRVEFTIKKL